MTKRTRNTREDGRNVSSYLGVQKVVIQKISPLDELPSVHDAVYNDPQIEGLNARQIVFLKAEYAKLFKRIERLEADVARSRACELREEIKI